MEWDPKDQATQGRHPPGFGPGNGQEDLSRFGGMQKWDLPPPPPPLPPLPAVLEDQNPRVGGLPSGLWNKSPLPFQKGKEHFLHADNHAKLPSTSLAAFTNSASQAQSTMGSMPSAIGNSMWPVSLPSENIVEGQSKRPGQEHISQGLLGTGAEEDAWTARTIDDSQNTLSLQEQPSSSGKEWSIKDAAWQHRNPINSRSSTAAVTSGHPQTGGPHEFPGSIGLQGFASPEGVDGRQAIFPLDASEASGTNLLNAWRAGQNITDKRDCAYLVGTRDDTGGVSNALRSSGAHSDPASTGVLRIQEDLDTSKSNFKQEEGWSNHMPDMSSLRNPGQEGDLSCGESYSRNPVSREICAQNNMVSEASILPGMNSSDSITLGSTSRQWWRSPSEDFLKYPIQRVERGQQHQCWIPPEYPGMPKLQLDSMSKDQLLDILPCPRIVFGGVFLLKESRDRLLQIAAPKHSNVYCDHMTVVYKPGAKSLLKLPIGKFVTLTVAGEVHNDSCQVVQVMPPSSVAPTGHAPPHITISIAEGAQPRSAAELASDVHSGDTDLSQKWRKPLQLIGVVGLRLDNRSTVLSMEEFFVRTGVNLRHVRRRLAEVLRPNGIRKQIPVDHGDHSKNLQTRKGQKAEHDRVAATQLTEIPTPSNGVGMQTMEKRKTEGGVPSEEEVRVLVEELTQQFAGLDKHVARQLLMVSEWNLASAQNYLRGNGAAEENVSQEAQTLQEQPKEEKNSSDSRSVGHLKGPGILHLPFDILEKSTVQQKSSGNLQPISQHQPRIVLDDSSPTKRKMRQDELRELTEQHRQRARDQQRLSTQYSLLAKQAHAKGKPVIARKYEEQTRVHKNLCQEQNKQAEELGYLASNLGKVCIHIMDFHLLHVSEALERCEKVVKNLQEFVDTVGGCLYKLKIITGRGNNSHKQTPVLRPQIMEYLQKAGYSPFLEESNPGVVCVYIEPDMGESSADAQLSE